MFPGVFALVLVAAVGLIAGVAVATYFERSRTQGERVSWEKSSRTLLDQLDQTRGQLDQAREEAADRKAVIARLEERHSATERMVEQMRVSLPETFKSLATDVLEEKTRRFAEQNQAGLGQVLGPLKERLDDFQNKIEAARRDQVARGTELSAQINQLFQSNTAVYRAGEQSGQCTPWVEQGPGRLGRAGSGTNPRSCWAAPRT